MSAYGLQLDAWLDDKLRAVPVPGRLAARLRRIPGLVSGGVVSSEIVGPMPHQALEAALVAVPLPAGLIDRLRMIGDGVVRGTRRRDRVERTAVAAVLLLAIGGSYAASLAAFLWASCPAARQCAAADQPRWFRGAFSSSEDFENVAVRFDFADADSPATRPVFNEAVVAAQVTDAACGRPTAARVAPDSEPLLLASGDVDLALTEYLDRLWRQGHGRHGGQMLLAHVGPSEIDDGFEAIQEYLAHWLGGRWTVWPSFREIVDLLDRRGEPAERVEGEE
ncbi:MAG TPA: hypothetical protein VMV69_07910 [Pirellulales bacterium]|nr:hypothetical protein [Pirellulales bacterium]